MMTDLGEILNQIQQGLDSGEVEIQITIKRKPAPEKKFVRKCKYCSWVGRYTRKDNAETNLKKHLSKCAARKEALKKEIPDGLRELIRANEQETNER
jgi:hypothetical protein